MDFATLLEGFRRAEEQIAFNRVLGLDVTRFDEDGGVVVKLPMRDELIGNYATRVLHGGVISATLDLIGGMVAMHGVITAGLIRTLDQALETFSTVGTIDLRVDYLRPGAGEVFTGTGHALRVGRSVTVTRMELRNEGGDLIAVGTGTYRIKTPDPAGDTEP